MIGSTRREELQGRFVSALSAWDEHIGSCPGCLRHGNQLCEDGYYLSGDVMQARAALEAVRISAAVLSGGAAPVGEVYA